MLNKRVELFKTISEKNINKNNREKFEEMLKFTYTDEKR